MTLRIIYWPCYLFSICYWYLYNYIYSILTDITLQYCCCYLSDICWCFDHSYIIWHVLFVWFTMLQCWWYCCCTFICYFVVTLPLLCCLLLLYLFDDVDAFVFIDNLHYLMLLKCLITWRDVWYFVFDVWCLFVILQFDIWCC